MKFFSSLILGAALFSSVAVAQVQMPQPMDVCEAIRVHTSFQSKVTQCMGIISKNMIDTRVIPLLTAVAASDVSETLNALSVVANKSVEQPVVEVCDAIRTHTSFASKVTACLNTGANQLLDLNVSNLLKKMASSDVSETVTALASTVNKTFQPSAVAVCENIRIHTSFSSKVTTCLNTIANKAFLNGVEQMCSRTADSDVTEAIKCMATIATDIVIAPVPVPGPVQPTPMPTDIFVTVEEIVNLKRMVLKTKAQMSRGNVQQALMSMEEILAEIQRLESQVH